MTFRILGFLLAAYYAYYSLNGYYKIFKNIAYQKKVGWGYLLLVVVISIVSIYYLIKNGRMIYAYYNMDEWFFS
jgi:hypothetical protein